ncbi:MAG: response regulator transcription factor [Lachnospiraceae bacterium]|nr:response regulator transcription factor [Lachnospiraceae bacterium]
MRILIIEDERALADALIEILKQNHYSADAVYDGTEGLDYARSAIYDLILLDIMLPGMDGLTILKTLRKEQISTPVILLTAKSEVSDIIAGLDAGSDDYLAKPFSTGELLARIRALFRRSTTAKYSGDILSFGNLSFNKGTMELGCGQDSLKLGLKEAQLIELLLNNPGQIIPKNLLIEKIWGLESNTEYNNIEVYISFLRQKLHSLGTNVQIKTVRGVGYQLEV